MIEKSAFSYNEYVEGSSLVGSVSSSVPKHPVKLMSETPINSDVSNFFILIGYFDWLMFAGVHYSFLYEIFKFNCKR